MDTKALRQKVLDLAVRGKLVPQDPNDEPASVLLERIRQQKQQMVNDGKLKANDIKNYTIIFVGEDNLHYEKFADGSVKCIEDEIPFDLPDGWAWARIASICLKVTDGTHHSPDNFPSGAYKYVTAKNIKLDGVVLDDITYVTAEVHREIFARCNPEFGDILYIKDGATSGIATVNTLCEEFSLLSSVALLKPAQGIDNWYMCYAMQSPYFYSTTRGDMKGVGITRITLNMLTSRLLPIPPQNEQQRISVNTRNQIELISAIESDKANILKMVSIVKSKILDFAIRGQLVPQDPEDEPASILLERIRAEKEELIRQGKIKRDKKESVIFRGEDNSYYEKIGSDIICIDEEIPFEIPDTWEWMRLESCCIKEIRRGKSPKYIDESGTLVFAQKCNTKYGGIDIGLALFLDESTLGRYPDDEYMQNGDVVINSTGTGTLGRVGIYHATDNHLGLPIVPDSHVTVIRAAHSIQSFYVYGFMKANQSELEKKGEGSTNQKELKPITLKELLIPIPPYSEQERITAAITAAFSTISAIEKSLS